LTLAVAGARWAIGTGEGWVRSCVLRDRLAGSAGAGGAGGKSIIGRRLKLSGMRWAINGATSIATARCQDASGNWDKIWQRPRSQTQLTDHARQASWY
jgi:hypothetical protein